MAVVKGVGGVLKWSLEMASTSMNIYFLTMMLQQMQAGKQQDAQNSGGKIDPPLTPDQVLAWNERITVWNATPIPERWQRLYNLQVNEKFSPAQQLTLLTFLYNSFWTGTGLSSP